MNTLIKCVNRNLILSAKHNNHLVSSLRFLNTTNVIESKANEIASRLGIPERPKKPLTGYFRFIQDIRPSLVKNDASPREVMALIGAEWKKLDENKKQKYNEQFERDRAVYLRKKGEYEKSLTTEQKLAIKNELIRSNELKEERAKKMELKEQLKAFGRPKRPLTSFFLFRSDENAKEKTNIKDARTRYAALNESQKNTYKEKTAALFEEYKKTSEAWKKSKNGKAYKELVDSQKPKTIKILKV